MSGKAAAAGAGPSAARAGGGQRHQPRELEVDGLGEREGVELARRRWRATTPGDRLGAGLDALERSGGAS